jgi:L-gulonate 3-dehydrogenase
MKERIAIVGSGLVGGGWAIVFARAGHEVAVFDAVPGAAERAIATIRGNVHDLGTAGLLDEAPQRVLARITAVPDLASAVRGADYVQESVLERVEIKRDVFAQIDAVLAPEACVGSSSSGIPASAYTDHVRARERCLVAHPVNPPYLAPVVELVPAPWTAPATLVRVRDLMERVGQAPVVLSREIEGFVLNRLQGVLLMEAWRLVEAGIASAADVDTTISKGLGLRWSFMGPFETIDLNAPGGIADYAARLGALYRRIAAETVEHRDWDAPLVARVEAERRAVLPASDLDARRRWRDRRLMALAAHQREVAKAEAAGRPEHDGHNTRPG